MGDTKNIIAILIGVAVIGGVAWWYSTYGVSLAPGGEGVACTQDAMQCSDGTWVGRTGPNCEFVCPDGTILSSGEGVVSYGSGVRGVVTAGSGPLSTALTISPEANASHTIATAQSDAQGNFEVSLPPGIYSIGAGGGGPSSCPATLVAVDPGSYVEIIIACTP